MKTITVWDSQGREFVCRAVANDHFIRESRNRLYCKVMDTDDHRGFTHVYFEDPTMRGTCWFYINSCWWECPMPLKEWSLSLNPPRKVLLRSELAVLCARILEINKELDAL